MIFFCLENLIAIKLGQLVRLHIKTPFLPLPLQISSLQSQIQSQEIDFRSQEDEMDHTKVELSRLQEEEAQLEQSLLSGRVQLDSIIKSLKSTQDEINQVSADGSKIRCVRVV